MIPVRLELRDFLSYGSPDPVDLTGFDVGCLTGPNGIGKSSLLDAITWSLWGAARGCEGGQNQDRLIRDGEEEASVAFTFELTGETYRVTRRRSRSGKAELRFEVRSGEGWTSLAGESLRDTEAVIADLLRMDHRTFTASAFFLQGRADDFLTRMRPEERKEVFARLLDLGVYERLEEAARAEARDAERERKRQAEVIERLAGVTDELEEVEARLAEATGRADEARRAADGAEAELESRRGALGRLEARAEAAEREREAVKDLRGRLEAHRDLIARRTEELGTVDELIARSEEVSEALAEGERLRARDAELRELAERRAALELEAKEIATRIEAARKEVDARCAERRQRLEALAREAVELERAKERREALAEQLASSDDVERALVELRATIPRLREEDGRLSQSVRELERRREELGEHLEILERGEGRCPVCGGELDDTHRRVLRADVEDELRTLATRLDECRGEREDVRKEGVRLKEEEGRLERSSAERRRLERTVGELDARTERLAVVIEDRERLAADLEADVERLAAGGVARAEMTRLRRLREEIEELGYDTDAHEDVRRRLDGFGRVSELAGQIREASSRREGLVRELDEAREGAEALGSELERRGALLGKIEGELEGIDELRERVEEAKRCVARSREAAAETHMACAKLSERRGSLRTRAEELERAREAERRCATVHRRHTRLAKAFGRGGIPDRIIENALPELEADANDVLGRLTDYEMSVRFAMDRLTKSGTVKETFDVLVHHEGGVRDFSMFSGGEAFRIAFSIRMGLSKLLVRRAGARLETLVIDEGFGTQDPEGRERLVEAINLAREEFRKVIVITHLDDLKDAFGAQLRVTKDPADGSTVTLVGA